MADMADMADMANMADMADMAVAVQFVNHFFSTNGVNRLMHTAIDGIFMASFIVPMDP